MRSLFGFAAMLAVALLSPAMAQDDPQQPTNSADAGVLARPTTPLGCFSSPGDMWDMGPWTFQTTGWCQPLCVRQGATYFAVVNGTNCFCGNSKPDDSYKVSSSECDTTCNGYKLATCGGINRWAIYADNYRSGDPTGSIVITTPSQTWFLDQPTLGTTLDTSVTKAGGQSTVVVTAPAHTSSGGPVDSGPNKTAIAVGVVVGVLVLGAIVGATVFYMRRRRQRELEDERRRHETVMNIVNRPEKPPSSFGSDSRLEPSVMFQRRQSDGSIMDNQDYSRRILKVTNPDDR